MDKEYWLMIIIAVLSVGALYGFFKTKTQGFGRYAISTLLLLFTISISSLVFVIGKLDMHIFANIIFAIIGFTGGLFTGIDRKNGKEEKNISNKIQNKANSEL